MARNRPDSHWRCKASGCEAILPEALDLCTKHWGRLAPPVRDAVKHAYREGDRHDHAPYMVALHRALCVLAEAEGRMAAARYHKGKITTWERDMAQSG